MLHYDLNEDGGTVTLSSTANANTTILNDLDESIKYFTDFSKYFLTHRRTNGEIISNDEILPIRFQQQQE